MKREIDYSKYINWINQQDVFFLKDMLIHFNIVRVQPMSMEEFETQQVIKHSKKYGYIQQCGKVKSNTQYITISKIPSDCNYSGITRGIDKKQRKPKEVIV